MNADERRFAQANNKEISVHQRLSALICVQEMKKSAFISVREMKKSAFICVCLRSSAFGK